MTLCDVLMVPAVAEKLPLVWPAAMVTDAGTDSSALELLSPTGTALADDCVRVTVQVLVALLASVLGVQLIWLNCAGAIRLNEMLCELVPSDAVMVAEEFEVMDPTVAVKVAELCPDATVTLPGTVTEELLEETVRVAPLEAAAESVAVQFDVPGT